MPKTKKDKIALETANVTRYVPIDDKFKKEAEVFFTAFEPKLNNRFIVTMGESREKSLFPLFVVKGIDRPSYVVGSGWTPITVSMYDPIVPSTAQAAFQNVILTPPPPFKTSILLLGPVGDKVESWILEECEIIAVNFGTLDWSTNTVSEVRLTMKYKDAILEY